MRTIGTLLLAAAAVLYYLVEIDRQSSIALSAVELDQALGGIRVFALPALVGVLCFVPGFVRGFLDDRAGAPPPRHVSRPARPSRGPAPRPVESLPEQGFRAAMEARLRAFDAGEGARIRPEPTAGVPFELVLEHLAPRSCERAVAELGLLLQTMPLPPRVRVVFDQCPEGPTPRQHMVSKALSQALDRGAFRATATAGAVEVRFTDPDPRWRSEF